MSKVTADTPVPDWVKAKSGAKLCEGTCQRWTRHSSMPISENPGTVIRSNGGKCQRCNNDENRNTPAQKEISAEKLAHTLQGLSNYMARRRQRENAR